MSRFVEITDHTDITDITVHVKLFKDQRYRLIFVAQHAIKTPQRTISYAYTINDGIMKVNEDAVITSGTQLEAFAFVDNDVTPLSSSENKKITLDRIVSQVNIGTLRSKEDMPSVLKVAVSQTPVSYDLVNNKYSDDTTTLTFDNIIVPGDEITVSETKYNRLTTLHFLGNNEIDIVLTPNNEDQETFTINRVNTKVNYKTNIVGNI